MSEEKIVTIANESTTNSLKDTLKHMKNEWKIKNLNVEIAVAEGARITTESEHRKIKEYSTSSANRRRFMMYILRATYENEPVSYKRLIKLLGISRNGLDTMINECLDANWISQTEIVEENGKNNRAYFANEVLCYAYDGYVEWLYRVLTNTGIRAVSASIEELERMLEHEEC